MAETRPVAQVTPAGTALRGGGRGRVAVVSDCNLFIQTMESWLPARRRKGTAAELKNYDLVCIGEALLAALRAACLGVTLTHVRSHQKRPPPTADATTRAFWHGNDRVDRVAGALIADKGPDFVLGAAPPLAHAHLPAKRAVEGAPPVEQALGIVGHLLDIREQGVH